MPKTKRKPETPVRSTRLLADRIVKTLFRVGKSNEADRLVLEMHDRSYGGGWCRGAARDVIMDAMKANTEVSGAVCSTDWLEPLAEDFAISLRLRVRMETSIKRETAEAIVKYATETFVGTIRSGANAAGERLPAKDAPMERRAIQCLRSQKQANH